MSYVQAYCAWKTAQDGQLVRYRVITEAEHQLIRNARDRSDAYLIGSSVGAPTAAVAGGVVVSGDKAAAGKAAGKAINISVTIGGAGAAVAAPRADNVDMVMQVSGKDAAKVR
jgi:formylglycine-generating enzyme required for sulfatase activity